MKLGLTPHVRMVDVLCPEQRVRFPVSVHRGRWRREVRLFLLGAIAGALLAVLCTAAVFVFATPQ